MCKAVIRTDGPAAVRGTPVGKHWSGNTEESNEESRSWKLLQVLEDMY